MLINIIPGLSFLMESIVTGLILALSIIFAGNISVELKLSVAAVELIIGILSANFLGIVSTPWLDYIAKFVDIILVFLLGTEIDTDSIKEGFEASGMMGLLAFVVPFLSISAFGIAIAGWSQSASMLAAVALSSTSVGGVYATMVENGLATKPIGKLVLGASSITNLISVMAIAILFANFTQTTLFFLLLIVFAAFVLPRFGSHLFDVYREKIPEVETKFLFAAIILLSFVSNPLYPILAAFILGIFLSRLMAERRDVQVKLRAVSFAYLTTIVFFRAGLQVSLSGLLLWPLLALVALKIAAKVVGLYTAAKKYAPKMPLYSSLLLSTGLTLGVITAIFGLSSSIIDESQFTMIMMVTLLSTIVSNILARRSLSGKSY